MHGADGLDEISTTGYTKVSECRDGAVNTFYLHPSGRRAAKAAPEALRGGDAADNAAIARRSSPASPARTRDIVLLNAAASLLIAGTVDRRFGDGIDAGPQPRSTAARAAAVLERLRARSRTEEAAA